MLHVGPSLSPFAPGEAESRYQRWDIEDPPERLKKVKKYRYEEECSHTDGSTRSGIAAGSGSGGSWFSGGGDSGGGSGSGGCSSGGGGGCN